MPWDPAGLAPYLTATEAINRLSGRFGISGAALTDGDMQAASDELDAMRPFVGWRRVYTQWRQFPRTVDPDGSMASADIPEAVLDAVALIAYSYAQDEGPPVMTEGAGGVNVTYRYPKQTLTYRRITERMRPYMRHKGQLGAQAPFVGADPLNQRQ